MSRVDALAEIDSYFVEGRFFSDLERRVAIPTESPNGERSEEMRLYLDSELRESLEPLGFDCQIFDNPVAGGAQFWWRRAPKATNCQRC